MIEHAKKLIEIRDSLAEAVPCFVNEPDGARFIALSETAVQAIVDDLTGIVEAIAPRERV